MSVGINNNTFCEAMKMTQKTALFVVPYAVSLANYFNGMRTNKMA